MTVVRKMPSSVNALVARVDRVSLSSIGCGQGTRGDALEESRLVADIPEIDVMGARRTRYRSPQTRGITKHRRASRVCPEGDIRGRLGGQFERCIAAELGPASSREMNR